MSKTPGKRFREALAAESPLQVIGAINANHALLAKRAGFQAIYLSGGGVAAGSLGLPDLGINTLEDVLIDVRRITDVCDLPLLVDIDTGFGPSAFNIERTVKSLIKAGAAAAHIEDQVGAKRCGHRPGKEIVSTEEMVNRILRLKVWMRRSNAARPMLRPVLTASSLKPPMICPPTSVSLKS
jgi:methylisocitrate lyase